MGGEFLEGEFFCGPLLLETKQNQILRPKNSGPNFGRPKFVSQNSALNPGSRGAKILGIIIRGVPRQGGTGLDTYQICIQASFDTYQIPFLI